MTTVNTTMERPNARGALTSIAMLIAAVLLGAVVGSAIVEATDDPAAGTARIASTGVGSGESVYANQAWYEDLNGFYLPAPAQAATTGGGSGESVYANEAWFDSLNGLYLPPPATVAGGISMTAGQLADAQRLSGLAGAWAPDQAVSQANAVPTDELTDIWQFRSADAVPTAQPTIQPEPVVGGYDYTFGTFVPPVQETQGAANTVGPFAD